MSSQHVQSSQALLGTRRPFRDQRRLRPVQLHLPRPFEVQLVQDPQEAEDLYRKLPFMSPKLNNIWPFPVEPLLRLEMYRLYICKSQPHNPPKEHETHTFFRRMLYLPHRLPLP